VIEVFVNFAHQLFENFIENVSCKMIINFPHFFVCSAIMSFKILDVAFPRL
jgi:hypothetical protein